jgi:hypothetical protein
LYYFITPELSDLLNETEPHAIGTARSNNNLLPTDIMRKKWNNEEEAV